MIETALSKVNDDKMYLKWLAEVVRGSTNDGFKEYKESFVPIDKNRKQEILERIEKARSNNGH